MVSTRLYFRFIDAEHAEDVIYVLGFIDCV